MKFAREVTVGNLHINWGPQWRADLMPYGGLKESGLRQGRPPLRGGGDDRAEARDHAPPGLAPRPGPAGGRSGPERARPGPAPRRASGRARQPGPGQGPAACHRGRSDERRRPDPEPAEAAPRLRCVAPGVTVTAPPFTQAMGCGGVPAFPEDETPPSSRRPGPPTPSGRWPSACSGARGTPSRPPGCWAGVPSCQAGPVTMAQPRRPGDHGTAPGECPGIS